MDIVQVISGFVLGLAVLAPIVLKGRQIIKEVGELLLELNKDLDDGALSMSEVKQIAKEAGDIIGIFKK